jgi:GNAT superfamily N-acetyltransferase
LRKLNLNMTLSFRAATMDDVSLLAENLRLGFETYRSFAPPGWDPPPAALERSRIAGRLPLPDAWCRIAEAGGEPAGHVAILAARERTDDRAQIPGVAHLWMLFVRERWWGSGLAARLHAMAVAEAAARGYRRMQLDTPALQARARAFYEREGWRVDGEPWFEPLLGLDIVAYRRALP